LTPQRQAQLTSFFSDKQSPKYRQFETAAIVFVLGAIAAPVILRELFSYLFDAQAEIQRSDWPSDK